MKILYFCHSQRMVRVFRGFPAKNPDDMILIPFGCDPDVFTIKNHKQIPKPSNKQHFFKMAGDIISKESPDVLVFTSGKPFARNYKGKRVFVAHGIHPDYRLDHITADLFCVGFNYKTNLPEKKLLRGTIPQFDLIGQVKANNTTILYAPYLISSNVSIKPSVIIKNFGNLVKTGRNIIVSIKNGNYEMFLSQKQKETINQLLSADNVYVINQQKESIYDYYGKCGCVVTDKEDTTVVQEAQAVGLDVYLADLEHQIQKKPIEVLENSIEKILGVICRIYQKN